MTRLRVQTHSKGDPPPNIKRLFLRVLLRALDDISETTKPKGTGTSKPSPKDFRDALEFFFWGYCKWDLEKVCQLAGVLPERMVKTAYEVFNQSMLDPDIFGKSHPTIFADLKTVIQPTATVPLEGTDHTA